MEIYRVPQVLIISLKRFKTARNRYGFGGGQKIDTLVEFPLEGLDLRPFVLNPEQRNSKLIYDCYGISNHFGSVGFGHYTAYGRNPTTGKWYDFDDSHVSEMSYSVRRLNLIITSAAYKLFFRLRSNTTMENLDFDELAQKPDLEFLESLKQNAANR
jgi:ubiquitin C-terminal hydrolase